MGREAEIRASAMRRWFAREELKFEESREENGSVVFRTHVVAGVGVLKGYDVVIICRSEYVRALFYPPIKVERRFYPQIAQYFGRINHRFWVGKWTMNYDNGEVRWELVNESSLDGSGSDKVISEFFGFSEFVCDSFAEGIVEIIMRGVSPDEAFRRGDARFDDDDGDPEGGFTVETDNSEANVNSDVQEGDLPCESEPVAEVETETGGGKCDGACLAADALEGGGASTGLPKGYSLAGLNIEGRVPLSQIVKVAGDFVKGSRCDVDAPRLNILLSGAPGTGKTAFAKYLAHEIGLPLRSVKASDILSKYVGETERAISKVFNLAKKNGEILFLDEIDGILIDRRQAEKSWVLSQTNTLLQEMESFSGILIGATNLVDHLDPAVMRRFTFKLRLSYLTDEGKRMFFERYFSSPLTDDEEKRLGEIGNLTPGDFRTVRELLYYIGDKQTNAARLEALEEEVAAKKTGRAKIGF